MVTVQNILDKKGTKVFSIGPDQTVYEALKMLADNEIGSVMVIENDKLLGIFSERDYARKLILKGIFSKEAKVKDVMSKALIVVAPDTDIFICMEIMTEKKFRHLPVVANGKLVGIISIGDIVNTVINTQEDLIKSLEKYISGSGYGHSA